MIEKGTRFTYLVTTGKYKSVRGGNGKTHTYYECKCDCGNVIWIRGTGLTYSGTKSCGCFHKRSGVHQKHGLTNHPLYSVWSGMRTRCNKKYSDAYEYYGARGISVCKEWDNTDDGFENFYKWSIENGFKNGLTIDRIDVNGNYEPNNCRWVTMKEQSRNKRSNHYIEYKGEKLTLAETTEKYGLPEGVLSNRLKNGWSVNDSIETPIIVKERKIEYKGKMITLQELSKLSGKNYNTICTRYLRGYRTSKDLLQDRNDSVKKTFLKIDKNTGEVVGKYLGSAEALKSVGGKARSRIIECCNGTAKSAYGYYWKYEQ